MPTDAVLNVGDVTFLASIRLLAARQRTRSRWRMKHADEDSDGDVDRLTCCLVAVGSWLAVTNQVPLNAGDGTFSTSIRI